MVGPTSSDDLTGLFAHLLAQFSGNALCNRTRCNTSRLGVPDHAGHASASLEANLWDLRGLSRTGFTGDDDNLVLRNGLRNFLAPSTDRKIGK